MHLAFFFFQRKNGFRDKPSDEDEGPMVLNPLDLDEILGKLDDVVGIVKCIAQNVFIAYSQLLDDAEEIVLDEPSSDESDDEGSISKLEFTEVKADYYRDKMEYTDVTA